MLELFSGYAPIPTGPAAAPKPAPSPSPSASSSSSTSSLQPPAGRGQGRRTPSPQGQRAAPVAAPRQPEKTPSPQKHPPSTSQSQKGRFLLSFPLLMAFPSFVCRRFLNRIKLFENGLQISENQTFPFYEFQVASHL